jgi:AraC-like DNA-binding protein
VVRARLACLLREDPRVTDRPISDIAHRWGFRDDGSHFTRTFEGHCGHSPTATAAPITANLPLTQCYTDLSRGFKLQTACSTTL